MPAISELNAIARMRHLFAAASASGKWTWFANELDACPWAWPDPGTVAGVDFGAEPPATTLLTQAGRRWPWA